MDESELDAKPLRYSRFLSEWVRQHPDRFKTLREDESLDALGACNEGLPGTLVDVGAEAFMQQLRRLRDERMCVIAWCDLAGIAALEDTLEALTRLAERCIQAALDFAVDELREQGRAPRTPPALIVIGMGKLGGEELNFSSDIDLLFSFRDPEDDGDSAREYAQRLARRVIQLLNELTEDGFVFRVDTRLRPFGDSGPLAASLSAMESYYQTHGREWERYAWIKARPVAGDLDGGRELIKRLRPFVYRRYLDYTAFESIREMKGMIEQEVARRGNEGNIKTGRGGIREIEFTVQAFQLIRGGHEPGLQEQRLQPTLSRLAELGHLPEYAVEELQAAYVFLRNTENRIQMWADQQSHDLPTDQAPRQALSQSMGFSDWDSFCQSLEEHRRRVHEQFQQVFAAPQVADETDDETQVLINLWRDGANAEEAEKVLAAQGFTDPGAAWAGLLELSGSSLYRTLGERGRRRLAELIPILIRVTANTDEPDASLARALRILLRIVGRTTYVALLVENPVTLRRLVDLCGASAWITRQIEQQPILLDSLLDPRVLYKPPNRGQLREELNRALEKVPADDLERRMDMLRQFRQQQMLRVAAADVSEAIPLMVVSDHLTDLAEIVLEAALEQAWRQMLERYGRPIKPNNEMAEFAVIGYGKLGGIELGYGSDLDVVFVHDGDENGQTDGKRALSHGVFFMRLAQRLIHLLATQTGAGRVYEVDTRLRPSGRSGLLVTSLTAFDRYQREKAWTWEHQALVRARPVAGNLPLADSFAAIRADILAVEREEAELQRHVVAMRDKMRANLEQADEPGWFDIKQAAGGLIDIEFLAQYAVLRYAHECRPLLTYSDTIRVLETMESAQLLDYATTKALTDAYRQYRRRIHAAALQEGRAKAGDNEFTAERAAVNSAWRQFLTDAD